MANSSLPNSSLPNSSPPLQARHLGLLPYAEAFALQKQLREQRLADDIPDTLLLLQHPPTITITRRFGRTHVLVSDEELARQHIALVEVDRGGDVTAHAPGQLVAYPIIKLVGAERDLPRFLRALEAAVISVLQRFGITDKRRDGTTQDLLRQP